ncbi:hypothetical protein BT96DRAFT_413255 [Gymnopus androsaceus JB14]|uniref:Uncharacterized protein n=1 Tax=Gymnopus androsaceus JB14 TaxID=1447944 RepID=A0A6A4I5H1_9AGAR|nr:hypothetical protein BT96DRAFT_413255 [Gymnopus androsaceus JB14]
MHIEWCPGSKITWASNQNLFISFPWARLATSTQAALPVLLEIHNKGRTVVAWSKDCTGSSETCPKCQLLPELFDGVEKVARKAAPGTNYEYLSIDRLAKLLRERYDELQTWKLKTLNLRQDLALANRRLDDHDRLLEAISTRNIPRVRQLIAQARKQEDLKKPIGKLDPCAFCGRSGQRECEVSLSFENRTTHIHSNCPYKPRTMQYGRVDKGSLSNPCRNVPVICDLCGHPEPERTSTPRPAVWRYNMIQHITLHHSEYLLPGINDTESDGNPSSPYDVTTT